jgi:hypothetical protein
MTTYGDSPHAEIQTKISALIADLSAGKISQEQFELIYTRYRNRLAVDEALTPLPCPAHAINTGDLLRGMQAKSLGLSFYHHGSGTTVEMIGQFDLPSAILAPILNDFSWRVEWQIFTDPVIQKIKPSLWVVFMARRYTTLMVAFNNEPSRQQIRQMERLHHNFEETNARFLTRFCVAASSLRARLVTATTAYDVDMPTVAMSARN